MGEWWVGAPGRGRGREGLGGCRGLCRSVGGPWGPPASPLPHPCLTPASRSLPSASKVLGASRAHAGATSAPGADVFLCDMQDGRRRHAAHQQGLSAAASQVRCRGPCVCGGRWGGGGWGRALVSICRSPACFGGGCFFWSSDPPPPTSILYCAPPGPLTLTPCGSRYELEHVVRVHLGADRDAYE